MEALTTTTTFRVTRQMRARERSEIGIGGPWAAPFDVPSVIRIIRRDEQTVTMVLEYGLGADEDTVRIGLPPATYASIGRLSGRVMMLQIQRATFAEDLRGIANALRARAAETPDEPGKPLRRGAHYRFIALALIPELVQFADECMT